MTIRDKIIAGGVICIILVSHSSSWGQTYRDNLPMPSLEINRQLMTYAQARDYEKITRTLPMVKPLTDALKTKFTSDIESELRSGLTAQDQDRILKATQRLVYLDLKDLMNLSVDLMGESNDKAKTKLKAAFLNYLLLSPFMEKLNFAADQKIKKNFRAATLAVDASTSIEEIKRLISEIDKELITTLAFSR